MATMLILPSKPLILSICHFWKIEDVHQGLQLGKTSHPRRTLPWRPTGLLYPPPASIKCPLLIRLLSVLRSIFLLLSFLRLGPWGSRDSGAGPSPRLSRLAALIEAAASGMILQSRFRSSWTCISPRARAVGFRFHLPL